jgi:hypothetical protein
MLNSEICDKCWDLDEFEYGRLHDASRCGEKEFWGCCNAGLMTVSQDSDIPKECPYKLEHAVSETLTRA